MSLGNLDSCSSCCCRSKLHNVSWKVSQGKGHASTHRTCRHLKAAISPQRFFMKFQRLQSRRSCLLTAPPFIFPFFPFLALSQHPFLMRLCMPEGFVRNEKLSRRARDEPKPSRRYVWKAVSEFRRSIKMANLRAGLGAGHLWPTDGDDRDIKTATPA